MTRYLQCVWDIGSDQMVILGAKALRLSAAKLWRFACLHSAATVYPNDVTNLSNVVGHFILTLWPTYIRGLWAVLWHLYSLISCSARLSRSSFWQPVLFFFFLLKKNLIWLFSKSTLLIQVNLSPLLMLLVEEVGSNRQSSSQQHKLSNLLRHTW